MLGERLMPELVKLHAAMIMAMTTPLMLVHPHPRFGIAVVPIGAITLHCRNARFPGDKLSSKS